MDEIEKEKIEDRTRVGTTQAIKTGFSIGLTILLVMFGAAAVILGSCSLVAYNAVSGLQQPFHR